MCTLKSKWLAGAIAAALWTAGPAWAGGGAIDTPVAGASAGTDQRAWLLAQLRAGEAAQRDDVVASALLRLRRIAPGDPGVLLAELRLDLRQQPPRPARALRERICHAAPATRDCTDATTLLRLYGPDADALRRAEQLQAMGRNTQALAGYQKLFGDDPPDFELAAKYWLVVGTVPARRADAIARLEALDRRYPGNIELRQGLVDRLFWAGRDAEALAWLGQLAGDPRASFAAAQREFDYLAGLPARQQTTAAWEAFMQRFPDAAWRAKAQRQLAMLRGARSAPVVAAVAAPAPASHVATSAPDAATARGAVAVKLAALRAQASAAAAGQDAQAAEALLREAHRLNPNDAAVVRQWAQLQLADGQGERALALLQAQPMAMQHELSDVVRRAQVAAFEAQADLAAKSGDRARAVTLLRQAHALQPTDPWLAFHLASAERAANPATASTAGDAVFAPLLAAPHPDADTWYAYALYLSASDRVAAALGALAHIPVSARTAGMHALEQRLRAQQVLAQARALHAAGDDAQAECLLLATGVPANGLLAAHWARARGDVAGAARLYRWVLARDPHDATAGLDLVELLVEQHQIGAARNILRANPPQPAATDYSARRRLANAWLAVGEPAHAAALFAALDRDAPPDALILRDSARALAADRQPAAALDLYARALAANHLLPAAQAAPRDDDALTRASRAHDGDGWLARSLRGDVDALYQAQNPTVTLLHDYAWRSDSTTPGSSDLARQTTILNATAPVGAGTGFAQVERVDLNAGRFATDADGLQHAAFGACALQWQSIADPAAPPAPAGCGGVAEAQTGYAFAFGWHNARWAFDLGHSPSGFAVSHWLGGLAYSGDWSKLGYTLTFSRRPIDSTLLSYAGARDPASGAVWGGVVATGATLNLSYDQGGANGVWAEFQQQSLTGGNVPSNQRSIAMAGWYRRLVARADTDVRTGLTLMYWHYQRDLGQFTLGQAGYYSPQQYLSLGVPFRFAHRSGNWSLDFDASVGWSWARFDTTPLYPDDVLTRVLGAGATPADFQRVRGDRVQAGSRSTGLGARLTGAIERRLSSHWVLGGQVSYYHSQDYAPSDAMLYLRYTFHRWQGDLPLPVSPIEPSSAFK